MLHQMTQLFNSAFYFRGSRWELVIIAVALGIFFGAVWLVLYGPPLIRKPGLWIVAVVSAFLTWAAIAFVQVPLQKWAGDALLQFWDPNVLAQWLLVAAIPQILLSGLVQEAAKLAPVIVYWWRSHRNFTPTFGLIAGAVSGAGFGIFEAVWVHNTILASGWTWAAVQTGGFSALLGFWERFFSVAFHIAVSALAGWGLAKKLGWQFYLVASLLHGIANYSVVLLQTGKLSSTGTEIYIAAFAVALTGIVLWLRWRRETTPGVAQESLIESAEANPEPPASPEGPTA